MKLALLLLLVARMKGVGARAVEPRRGSVGAVNHNHETAVSNWDADPAFDSEVSSNDGSSSLPDDDQKDPAYIPDDDDDDDDDEEASRRSSFNSYDKHVGIVGRYGNRRATGGGGGGGGDHDRGRGRIGRPADEPGLD